jgi:hypothetical protein
MKPVKTLLSVVALLFALAATTPAGEQETPGYVAPPPTHVMTTSADTDTSSVDPISGDTVDTSDYFLFTTIEALLSVY